MSGGASTTYRSGKKVPFVPGKYALIGDCEIAALVGRNGSIDWRCWPNFASVACFASLLGSEENGFWRLAPQESTRTSRRYEPDTLILKTIHETRSGTVEVTDFMPPRDTHSHVVRVVKGLSGKVKMLSGKLNREPVDVQKTYEKTCSFWTQWTGQCTYQEPHRELVTRSMITLKTLTFRPTGGVVSAPTTSLPEDIGGVRNWDYRYCWLRDTTFTLLALMNSSYYDEARNWMHWLRRTIAGKPDQLQIMCGIPGERTLAEWEIKLLPGYENSSPVRIGNAASQQLQLDTYGEVADAFFWA
jgi:GH15 family glucan-1,4-alpha-glucosidase